MMDEQDTEAGFDTFDDGAFNWDWDFEAVLEANAALAVQQLKELQSRSDARKAEESVYTSASLEVHRPKQPCSKSKVDGGSCKGGRCLRPGVISRVPWYAWACALCTCWLVLPVAAQILSNAQRVSSIPARAPVVLLALLVTAVPIAFETLGKAASLQLHPDGQCEGIRCSEEATSEALQAGPTSGRAPSSVGALPDSVPYPRSYSKELGTGVQELREVAEGLTDEAASTAGGVQLHESWRSERQGCCSRKAGPDLLASLPDAGATRPGLRPAVGGLCTHLCSASSSVRFVNRAVLDIPRSIIQEPLQLVSLLSRRSWLSDAREDRRRRLILSPIRESQAAMPRWLRRPFLARKLGSSELVTSRSATLLLCAVDGILLCWRLGPSLPKAPNAATPCGCSRPSVQQEPLVAMGTSSWDLTRSMLSLCSITLQCLNCT